MKKMLVVISLLLALETLKAQDDYFDTPTITALIEHNKQNYADHQELRDKQIASQATVSA
jgi:hypothetical protein